MNSFIESLMGMDKLSDQVIATDMILAAKASIRSYAVAITETTSPEVRSILRKQLADAISSHEKLTNYMMKRDFYNPYDLNEQQKVNMQTTETVLSFPVM